MGKSYSKGEEADFSLDMNQWEEISQHEIQENNKYGIGQPVTLRNCNSGQLVDAYYPAFLSKKQYEQYRQNLEFRKNQSNIVRALYYKPAIQKQFCSTTYGMTVFIEHVRGRLSQYKDIPLRDSLYCMMAMLEGYRKLFNEVGRFYVSEDQTIIDEKGEVRVWLNSDFSKDIPEESDERWAKWGGSENDMVEDILSIVIENTDEADGPRLKFSDFFEREKIKYGNKVGFEEAKHIIIDYSKASGTDIPSVFESVLQIYQQNEGQILNQNQFAMAASSDIRNFQDYPFDSQERDQTHIHNASHQSAYPIQEPVHSNQQRLPITNIGTGFHSNGHSTYSNQQFSSQPREIYLHPPQQQEQGFSYMNYRGGSAQNFYSQAHPAVLRNEPARMMVPPHYPVNNNPQIIINAHSYQPQRSIPIYQQPRPIHISPPQIQANRPPFLTNNLANTYKNAPISFKINGQSMNNQPQNFFQNAFQNQNQSINQFQNQGQGFNQAQQVLNNQNQGQMIPARQLQKLQSHQQEREEQVNEEEVIEKLEQYHRQASDEYSSERDYQGGHNEILDEALEQQIERQINPGEEQEEEYSEREHFYERQDGNYPQEQYYSDRNRQSYNSRDEFVNVNNQSEHHPFQNSSHNNSIHNNSIQNTRNQESIQNTGFHINNSSGFRQSGGESQNVYWQNNYSMPPVPFKTTTSTIKKTKESKNYERSEKDTYYTLNNEIELDPEIAADLAMLV